MFTEEQKDEIYNYYIKYEKWKIENNYFDFQDVVNFLIRQVSIELVPRNIKLIDILFIDEVQDFSINQLYLMSLISRDIKVLAGDTCQTISKTNSFRFCDLNSIYYIAKEINNIIKNKNAVDIKEPKEIQTNLNFRCHYPVLKLAHLIFEMIFLLFPQTLDKVKCDFTKDISGYQPSIITDLDSFIKKLTGEVNEKNNIDKNNNKKEFTFAFNHCFICRNIESEKRLSEKYNKKILASTITESKGMEFEIVIIYNFFKDAYPFVLNLWSRVLTHMKFQKTKNQYIQNIQKELEYEEVEQKLKDEIDKNFKEKIAPTFTKKSSLLKQRITSTEVKVVKY
jgi:superfamily I DNA/RNA helicase